MLKVTMRHRFDGFTLDVDFQTWTGVTALFGRSGTGKTTIVNALSGILRPDFGQIAIGDDVLLDTTHNVNRPPHRRRLAYIFQDARLFPHLTVEQNLRYGSYFATKRSTPANRTSIVDMLGIGHLTQRRPSALSGGERQRVAIGRALLSRPLAILADEPLASLDNERKEEILPYFERLRDEAKVPILYVSHSVSEVARLANDVVALDGGRIVRQGPANEILGDPSVLATGARQAGAILKVTVRAHHRDGLTELDAGGTPLFVPRIQQSVGAPIRVRISASDVILSRARPEGLSALNIVAGVVGDVRLGAGPGAILAIDTSAGRLLARITRRSYEALDLSVGVPVHAVFKTVSVASADIGNTGVALL